MHLHFLEHLIWPPVSLRSLCEVMKVQMNHNPICINADAVWFEGMSQRST